MTGLSQYHVRHVVFPVQLAFPTAASPRRTSLTLLLGFGAVAELSAIVSIV